MATDTALSVCISKIAGRYLVFSPDSVAHLRRAENTNGNLVGCVPQQPTQNIFLGLPIELRSEEANALVAKGAAHIVDDVAAHLTALNSHDRSSYMEGLRRKKMAARQMMTEQKAQKAAMAAEKYGRSGLPPSTKSAQSEPPSQTPNPNQDDDLLFAGQAPLKQLQKQTSKGSDNQVLGVTPTSTESLLSDVIDREFMVRQVPDGPLCRFLQGQGYHMTPGLRFGSKYSVYPGDPLRFHAHFMANEYDWDEAIPILDIVEGGRLATAVKKAFVIGGEEPGLEVRTYSLEWAGM